MNANQIDYLCGPIPLTATKSSDNGFSACAFLKMAPFKVRQSVNVITSTISINGFGHLPSSYPGTTELKVETVSFSKGPFSSFAINIERGSWASMMTYLNELLLKTEQWDYLGLGLVRIIFLYVFDSLYNKRKHSKNEQRIGPFCFSKR